MKLFLSIILLSIIAGCSSTATRGDWANEMYKVRFGDLVVKENPEYVYCFGGNEADVSTDINWIWKDVVKEKESSLEPHLDVNMGEKYGAEIGTETLSRYIMANRDRYLPAGLAGSEMDKCKSIFGSKI